MQNMFGRFGKRRLIRDYAEQWNARVKTDNIWKRLSTALESLVASEKLVKKDDQQRIVHLALEFRLFYALYSFDVSEFVDTLLREYRRTRHVRDFSGDMAFQIKFNFGENYPYGNDGRENLRLLENVIRGIKPATHIYQQQLASAQNAKLDIRPPRTAYDQHIVSLPISIGEIYTLDFILHYFSDIHPAVSEGLSATYASAAGRTPADWLSSMDIYCQDARVRLAVYHIFMGLLFGYPLDGIRNFSVESEIFEFPRYRHIPKFIPHERFDYGIEFCRFFNERFEEQYSH